VKPVAFSERDLVASICRESFYEFVKEFWDTIISEQPVWNWHIKYICDELQMIAERVFIGVKSAYDLIINISPGSTKSTICSVMFPAWVWTRMPSARFIGGSYASPLAVDLSRKNRDIIISDKYMAVFPEIKLRIDLGGKVHFANTKKGERYACGVGGSVTGMHGHFIIIDDPINPNEVVSETELANVNRWMNETLPTRKVEKSIVPTILIMQRLHQNDPTANMINTTDKGNIKHICLPAELTDKVKPVTLRKYYKDGLFDPVRLSREVLESNKLKGQFSYAGQFLQHPVPLGGGMFQWEKITVSGVDNVRFIKRLRYWDNAGTKGGGCYTAGVLMGKDTQKRWWVLDVVRGQWDSASRENIKRSIAIQDGTLVEIGQEQEPGSGGKESAQNTVRNLAGFRVRVDRPTGDKVQRADPFSVQVNNGNVFMKKAEWNRDYINELQYFPFSTYKDQVDASSGAFALLNKGTRVGSMFSTSSY
jgi:predicted phage terminase large subunit-like protein